MIYKCKPVWLPLTPSTFYSIGLCPKVLQKLVNLPPGRCLVVAHGAILGKVLFAILGITPQGHYNNPRFYFRNLMYMQLTYQAERRQWSLYNFTSPELWDGRLGD